MKKSETLETGSNECAILELNFLQDNFVERHSNEISRQVFVRTWAYCALAVLDER